MSARRTSDHPGTSPRAARALGRELDRWRIARGMTQVTLQRVAKISQGQLSRVLAGRFIRRTAAIDRLCRAAGIDAGQALGDRPRSARTERLAPATRPRAASRRADPESAPAALVQLGITATEERIYRHLLGKGDATGAELMHALRAKEAAVARGLASLERNGFVSQSPEATPRYVAAPPDLAVAALELRRQLQSRAAIQSLRECADARRDSPKPESRVVEILSREAAAQVFAQIMSTAQTEILCLERLPVLVSENDRPSELSIRSLARGVGVRSIADKPMLEAPRTLQRLRLAVQAGERYRIYPALPFKLVVVDRRIGIIPLNLSEPNGPVLLVRTSSLLEALCEAFELLWRAAVPFALDDGDFSLEAAPDGADARRGDALFPLLASGLNDKAIEQELGISQRTLARRMARLLKQLGATTRFQAGWLAASAMHRGVDVRIQAPSRD